MKMIEQRREREYQRKTERDFNRLMDAVQPVLDGERESMDILVEQKHHLTERINVNFFPVPGVFGDKGKRLFEMLKHELGYDAGRSSELETRELDHYHNESRQQFPTNRENIVLVKSEAYEGDPDDPERITWSIEHLHPKKGIIQRAKERTSQLVSNLLRAPRPV